MTATFVAIGLFVFALLYAFVLFRQPKKPPRQWYDVKKPKKPWPKG